MEEKKLDCFGWMYEPKLIVCRETCAARISCKETLKKHFDELGEEDVKKKQRSIIVETEKIENNEQESGNRTIAPSYSDTVVSVCQILTELGLECANRVAYIAFKAGKVNIFSITATKSTITENLVKIIYTRDREEFSRDVEKNVSEKKHGGFYCLNFKDLDELKVVAKKYLESIASK